MILRIERLSTRQKTNLESALKAYKEKSPISSPSPPVLYIELTRNCISRCSFCRSPNWENSPSYDMSDKTFNTLLDLAIPGAVFVDLRGWGESLMLPNLDARINAIAHHGPRIQLLTTLGCRNPKALQSIIDNDVYLSVTFDAANKRLYERTRKGISYNTVISNLEFLTKAIIKKHGTTKDMIRICIVPLRRDNLNQVEPILRVARRYHISGSDPFTPILPTNSCSNIMSEKVCGFFSSASHTHRGGVCASSSPPHLLKSCISEIRLLISVATHGFTLLLPIRGTPSSAIT